MKTIAFYVTDLGFGHITRSLAIIEKILESTSHHIYLTCGELQIDYATVFLSKYSGRVTFNVENTEAGTVLKEDSFECDKEATESKIQYFLDALDESVASEYEKLREMDVALVITDISILGIHVAKRLGVKVVGVTNYTYYHRYKKIGVKENLMTPFLEAYNSLDHLYELALSDDLSDIDCPKESVGFIAREVNNGASFDYKARFWPSCFLSIGQIANRGSLEVDFQSGHVYATGNVDIVGNAHVVKLPKRVSHSQDYIAASSLAIVKPGWSVVAECMISGIPFGVIDVNQVEDGEIIQKLIESDQCFILDEEELNPLNIKDLNMKAAGLNPQEHSNDAGVLARKIVDWL